MRITRGVVVAALLVALGPAAAIAKPTPSGQLRTYDKKFLKYVNHARENHGLKPLRQSNRLYKIAHKWAEHMAATQNLEHNPNAVVGKRLIFTKCPHSTMAAENVGWQGHTDARALFKLYMHEPYHRANILQPKHRDVGIATVRSGDGREWNVQDFGNHCR